MISVQGLTKYYNDFCALKDVSFEVKKGEILGILGPNGAGKTTTLRILTCYMFPTDGSITVKDYNINDNPIEIKKMIGYLPESAPLYKEMIVYDYLQYIAEVRELPEEKRDLRIKELSKLCGLSDVMHKAIDELSKGYKQRVGLAQAMMGDPEILVLDEPTSGLDPNQIVEIRELIKEIGKEKTVILSTHILSEVEATCDRVVIINKGKLVADGSTETLKQESSQEQFINLSLKNASLNDIKSAMTEISIVKSVNEINAKDGQISVSLVCDTHEDIREKVYSIIKNKEWILLEMYQESKTLENIFRELTKEKSNV